MNMVAQMEQLLKALGDEKRLRILKLLEKRPMCVCELAFILKVTQPSVSRHLKKLFDIGLIGCEKKGFWTDYFLVNIDAQQKKILRCVFAQLDVDKTVVRDRVAAVKLDRTKLCGCQNKCKGEF